MFCLMSIRTIVCMVFLIHIERSVSVKTYTDIIRGLREDRDIKQIEIANVLGTSQQHYSKYENGEYELPLRALGILADYYGVSADYLMGRTESREGVAGLNKKVSGEYTMGALTSDVLSLDAKSRDAVIDYISLQKLRMTCTCTKKKDGPRV